MNTIIFYYPADEKLARNIAKVSGYSLGEAVFRQFPDKESHVKIITDVKSANVILVCSLNNPNEKIMPIIFFTQTAKRLGAKNIGLIAPYLCYLRQDKEFTQGEAISSKIFARLLSDQIDWLVTLDPHLHRHHTLGEIYTVPAFALHTAQLISEWIKVNVNKPVLVGPDEESKQWVKEVAGLFQAPFMVLQKIRRGDRDVEISAPDILEYKDHTPVLVDDIISTASTMIQTVRRLHDAGMMSTVCIGVHAIFANGSYQELLQEKVAKVITCNTIEHKSNLIDVSQLIVNFIKKNIKL